MQILSFPLSDKPPEDLLRRWIEEHKLRFDKAVVKETAHIHRYRDIGSDQREIILYDFADAMDDTVYVWKVPYGKSVYGLPIMEKPYACAEWYGSRIYFANKTEFEDFMLNRFKITLIDYKGVCPLCGSPMMNQLRYVYADGSGLPYDLHFCSRECLSEFMLHYNMYCKIFSAYLGHLDLTPPDYVAGDFVKGGGVHES